MKYLNLAIAFLMLNSLSAQYSESENTVVFHYDIDYKVELDTTISLNRDHVLSDYIVDQGEDYVEWVYRLNEQRNKSSKKGTFKTNLVNDKGVQNSLVFSLTKNGEMRYDTLSNMVDINMHSKPKKMGFFRKLWNRITMPNVRNLLDKQDIKGSLPEGCMSWVSVSGSRLKCGVEIIKASSEVTMVLKSKNDEIIHSFAQGTLHRGWNNYKWNRGDHKKGTYILSITVDGQTMTQNINFD